MRLNHKSLRDKVASNWCRVCKHLSGVNPSACYHSINNKFTRKVPKSLANRILVLQLTWAFIIYVFVITAHMGLDNSD